MSKVKTMLAEDLYIYPSANAGDGGEINGEDNLSLISLKFSHKNFVIKNPKYPDSLNLSINQDQSLGINPGECSINGKYVKIENKQSILVNDLSNSSYNVVVFIRKDASGKVQGDSYDIETHTIICKGCAITLLTDSELGEFTNEYVLLGEATVSSGEVTKVENNESKYVFIDTTQIGGNNNQTFEEWMTSVLKNIIPYSESKGFTDTTKVYSESQFVSTSSSYNGESTNIARADHNHDSRYVHRINDSTAPYNQVQRVYTGLSMPELTISDGTNVGIFASTSGMSIGSEKIPALLSLYGDMTVKGVVNADKVYGAYWNDIAEWYRKEDEHINIESGRVISKSSRTSLNTYTVANKFNSRTIVGVSSNSYGFILGGDSLKNMEDNKNKFIPVALAGRVRVRLSYKGSRQKIKAGDYLKYDTLSNGMVCKATLFDKLFRSHLIIGKSLESKGSTKYVLTQVFLR